MSHKHPLNIDSYSVTSLFFTCNEGFSDLPEFSIGTVFAIKQDDPKHYRLELNLSSNDIVNSKDKEIIESEFIYSFNIRIVGYFHISDDFKGDNYKDLAYNGGFSILYGVARQQLLDLTAKQPTPSFILPVRQFFMEADKKEEAKRNQLKKNNSRKNISSKEAKKK